METSKIEWIFINDKMPPISTDKEKFKVMIYSTVAEVTTGFYWGKTKETDPCKGWSIAGVTHWAPLLEKPNF